MTINGLEYEMDLGCDHWLKFTQWKPDRELNPQYAHLPDCDRLGALIAHKKPDGSWCVGGIYFDNEQTRFAFPVKSMWSVSSWEPLTMSPSFLCMKCNDHGFIRDGKWVVA